RADARGVHVRGQGPALRHPHEAAARRARAAGQLLRERGPRPRRPAGTGAMAAPGAHGVRRRDARRLPRAPAAHDPPGGAPRDGARRPPARAGLDRGRRRPPARPRARAAARVVRRRRGARPPARARGRVRDLRRRGDLAARRRRDEPARVRAPPRRPGALHERVPTARARRVGRARAVVARRRARRRGLPRQRRRRARPRGRARARGATGRRRAPGPRPHPRAPARAAHDDGAGRARMSAPDRALVRAAAHGVAPVHDHPHASGRIRRVSSPADDPSDLLPAHLAAPSSSPYVDLDRAAWSRLSESTPLPLTDEDVTRLRGLGDPIDLAEVDAVYRPLSRLLNLYVTATSGLHEATSTFLREDTGNTPYVIGVAGSVAVGKSTTARVLREMLARWPETPHVELITTDGFLYPNAELARRGLMERKGFPESYDRRALIRFLSKVKAGHA